MKYAIPFVRDEQLLSEVDEVVVNFLHSENLIDFITKHEKQRVIINIGDPDFFISQDTNMELLKKINEISQENKYNIAIRIEDYKSSKAMIPIYDELNKANVPMFFNTHCSNWDTLIGLLEGYNVSDIYVTDELGFELDKVSKVVHNYGANVRVFPNIAQSVWFATPGLLKFFIMPEDIQYYEDYVDVCEIFSPKLGHLELAPIVKSYKDQKWFGRFDEFIIDYIGDLDSKSLVNIFGERRATCGKKCQKGSHCRICHRLEDLNSTLGRRGFYFADDTE